MNAIRRVFTTLLAGLAVSTPYAAELVSPGLPASPEQSFACRIVNVSPRAQVVTTQAVDSTAGIVTSARNEVLMPGEASGISVPGAESSMYCRFIVTGMSRDYRASIEVFEMTPAGHFRIVAALPAS
jgi:hypothetical protein